MTDTESQQEKATEEATVIEETPAGAEETPSEKSAPEPSEDEKPSDKGKGAPKRRRKFPWLTLFLLIVIGGGLATAWQLMPEKSRQQVSLFVMNHIDRLEGRHASQPTEPAATSGSAAPEAAAPAATETSQPSVAAEPAATPEAAAQAASAPPPAPESAATLPAKIPAELPAAAPAVTEKPAVTAPATSTPATQPAQAATSPEISALTASVDRLTAELREMQSTQQQLRQSMLAQQNLTLRSRLHRIVDRDSLLPQMAADWQDILLLPILSEAQRTQATAMQRLAARDAADIRDWRKRLEQLAASLPLPEQGDIIPKPDNTWLSWLTGQFHLRPSPTAERRALTALRNRLFDADHALAAEKWPDAKSWRSLLGEVRNRFGKKALGLPENLDSVHQDKLKIRMLAQNWLENL